MATCIALMGPVAVFGVVASGCTEKEAPPLKDVKPRPLPELPPLAPAASSDGGALSEIEARERLFQVEAAPVWGDEAPDDVIRAELVGEKLTLAGQPFDSRAPDAAKKLRTLVPEGEEVLIVPDDEVFLAEAAALLALLDDARVKTWLLHPDGKTAFPIALSDETDFKRWLDEIAAGKIRIIHRADGYELQTNVGKLPGADPNGPTVPRRGGKWDIARLRQALQALKHRFHSDAESCLVPSFGMQLEAIAQTLTAYYTDDGDRLFPVVCLVYPRLPPPGANVPASDAGR